ncbi:glycosyltransferase family 2 protein [Thiofilum flexile]|uniref:glycosyltransferase family 2 protein n=1 Tax=Thiofilum flexile TaxID=125627 RepID=UPI00037FA796|nr:glycosyltransferase family 2 protein [Thiofilum flexile]
MLTKIYRPEVAIIVLTRNAGALWPQWIQALQKQTILAGRYIVIDTESTDHTVALAAQAGFEIYRVRADQFNHGGTRRWAAEHCVEAKYLVYLTQDAILTQTDSLERLLEPVLNDAEVALVYGRHVARAEADLLEQHARLYNYPDQSASYSRADFARLGYRAAFASDVYAVYRATALQSVGGFPEQIIVSEDSYLCARLLLAGWKAVYNAESRVEHSHNYSLLQLARRYFDVGVFHAVEAPLLASIGKPDQEAGRYVKSLIRFLAKRKPHLLPWAALQTLVKLLAFRLGKHYQSLPRAWCERISLQNAYWQQLKQGSLEPIELTITALTLAKPSMMPTFWKKIGRKTHTASPREVISVK